MGIVNATSKFTKGVTASKAMNVVQKARNIAQNAFQFVLDKIKSVKGKVFSGSRSGTSSKDLQEMLGKLSDRMQAVLGGQGSLGRKLATDFAVGSTRTLASDYLYENYGIDLPFFPLNRKAFSTKLGVTSRGTGMPKKQGQGNKGTGKDDTSAAFRQTEFSSSYEARINQTPAQKNPTVGFEGVRGESKCTLRPPPDPQLKKYWMIQVLMVSNIKMQYLIFHQYQKRR